jgi:uroporphyrinogen-III synthase
MNVIVTRPYPQSDRWVKAIQSAGCSAQSMPLIELAPVENTTQIQVAAQNWRTWQSVMFVSAQAVQHFFAAANLADYSDVMCWATGPGTRRALLESGVPEQNIVSPAENSMQFDSEALWQLVQTSIHTKAPVLIVRGQEESATPTLEGTGRDWLADQLQARGVTVHKVVAYERRVPQWTDQQRQTALQAISSRSIWVFSSSLALSNLCQLVPSLPKDQLIVWGTHPRIVEKATALGFTQARVCAPTLVGVIEQIRKINHF